MKDFKFTEAERGDLEDAMYDLQWKEEIDVVLDRIETIIQSRADADIPTPSDPSQDSVEQIVESILGKCNCDNIHTMESYENREHCTLCDWREDFIKAMTTYASAVCADKDREIMHLNEKVLALQNLLGKRRDELAEAKRRIAELEDTWTGKENGLPKPK